MSITAKDMREFSAYLRGCTDAQVRGCFEKERDAGREEYVELCLGEAARRSLPWFYEEPTHSADLD